MECVAAGVVIDIVISRKLERFATGCRGLSGIWPPQQYSPNGTNIDVDLSSTLSCFFLFLSSSSFGSVLFW